jgi:hypothetical protein
MKYLLFGILFFISVFGVAQNFDYEPDIEEVKMRIGVYGGLNSSRVLSHEITTDKGRLGYQYGFYLSYNQPIFLRTDFTLNQINSHISIPDTADPTIIYKDYVNMRFFNLPIQIGYNYFSSYDVTAWIAAGSYYEFFYGINENQPKLKRSDIVSSSFGIHASTGVRYSFLIANIAYAYGLGPVFKDDMQSRKRVFSVSVGFRF